MNFLKISFILILIFTKFSFCQETPKDHEDILPVRYQQLFIDILKKHKVVLREEGNPESHFTKSCAQDIARQIPEVGQWMIEGNKAELELLRTEKSSMNSLIFSHEKIRLKAEIKLLKNALKATQSVF